MALGTLSVCLSVIVLNFHHKGGGTKVPRWAQIFFIHYCGRLFGFRFDGICPKKFRECPNNYRTPNHIDIDPQSPEIQNILPKRQTKLHGHENQNHDNYIINETMHYHNVDVAHIKQRKLKVKREKTMDTAESKDDAAQQWQMLAKVLDSIFFTVVFITMLVSACLILLSPWYIDGGPKA